ncbi:MAG TPA: cupin domain-containing protein [Stellaceae bacterium]|nr:cupin domain-containing protein [Stellaceae bacterium]
MEATGGKLFANVPKRLAAEQFRALLAAPNLRIERIVSTGQATPEGEWLDQSQGEWVMLLRGAARLRFEGEDKPRLLKAGDYVNIPPHCRHRVEWTTPREPTIWLAVHYAA